MFILEILDREALLIPELVGQELGVIGVLDLLLLLDFSIHTEQVHLRISLHLCLLKLICFFSGLLGKFVVPLHIFFSDHIFSRSLDSVSMQSHFLTEFYLKIAEKTT